MISSLLKSLNDKQKQAVEKPLVPILVLAGPGTGKTRMLVARIGFLIQNYSFKPQNILALTFTNKAANEMKSRLINQFGHRAKDVYTSTIHSFALDLLKKFYNKIGLAKNFSICDREYQTKLMRKLCSGLIKDDIDNKVRALLLSISNHQMQGTKLSAFAEERYDAYKQYLSKNNLLDFNQIILKCHTLLVENNAVLREYQHLYPAILIDEFQDTDIVQYEIIKMLALKEKNIFVVADDDQSIYSWRGANPENINKYINDFRISDVDFLEMNYRSGQNIIQSAHRIIKNTKRVEPNKIVTSLPDNFDDIRIYMFLNESDEIDFILKKLKNWIDENVALKDIAIVYPFHKIGSSLEHYLLKFRINYQMATGNSILDNPFLSKLVLFLKVILNASDEIAIEQLSENELGLQLTRQIRNHAIKNNLNFRRSLYEFYKFKKGTIDFNSLIKIKSFISQIANLVNLKSFYSLNQIIDEIFNQSQQQKYSFLIKHSDELDILDDFNPEELLEKIKNPEIKIFVYHPDKKLEHLAIALIHQILERKVESFSENTIEDKNKKIVFELVKSESDIKHADVVPVYRFANDNRRGSLSNLFKILQTTFSQKNEIIPEPYVILDLETTDKEISNCGIVEIAAIKIQDGKIVDELQTLINPQLPIAKSAEAVHHISDKDVVSAPTIEQYWPKLLKFIGDYLIIAHNGYAFDFAILDRFSKKINGNKLLNLKLDSLAMAQNLFPDQSNSIDSLVDKFQLDAGERHRALDDVKVLFDIITIFIKIKKEIIQKTIFEIYSDIVALGNYYEKKIYAKEDRIFFISGLRKLLSPYDTILDQFCKQFNLDKIKVVRLLRDTIKTHEIESDNYKQDDNILFKLKLLANDFNHLPIDEAIAGLISHLQLKSAGQDNLENINAVSLLTFHAAKGLEFEKVILMGMEKNNIPGFHALREDPDDQRSISKKLEEQRRLLYVGITRAKSEIILTAVKNRGGWENESSPFLKDLNIPKVVINN